MPQLQKVKFHKRTKDLLLVILQFCIIILHFFEFKYLPKKEILQVNSISNMLGYLIIAFALFIMIRAIQDLGSNLSPFPKPKVDSKLITSGIYSYIRHPMYCSLILFSFGVFITQLSFYYLSLTIILIFFIKLKIFVEERYLNHKFENYSLYKNKVKY